MILDVPHAAHPCPRRRTLRTVGTVGVGLRSLWRGLLIGCACAVRVEPVGHRATSVGGFPVLTGSCLVLLCRRGLSARPGHALRSLGLTLVGARAPQVRLVTVLRSPLLTPLLLPAHPQDQNEREDSEHHDDDDHDRHSVHGRRVSGAEATKQMVGVRYRGSPLRACYLDRRTALISAAT